MVKKFLKEDYKIDLDHVEALSGNPDAAKRMIQRFYTALEDNLIMDPLVMDYMKRSAHKVLRNLEKNGKPKADSAFGFIAPNRKPITTRKRNQHIALYITALRKIGYTTQEAIEACELEFKLAYTTIEDIYKKNKKFAEDNLLNFGISFGPFTIPKDKVIKK